MFARHAEEQVGFLRQKKGGFHDDFQRRPDFTREMWRKQEGQTMAEYGVVLAVITIGAVGVFTLLSGGITNSINKVTGLLP